MAMITSPAIHHLNAVTEDLLGNGSLGRYILLPGSDGRARRVADRLVDCRTKSSDRQLNLYLGRLPATTSSPEVDVAVVSTGMGCPSLDIVLNELLYLGGRTFVRIGTAGALQRRVKFGHLVVALGAVRDEGTTRHYAPLEFPALADIYLSEHLAAAASSFADIVCHSGVVHCKDSLHAREFGEGPFAQENKRYMSILSSCGVLASEMETAALFIRTALAAALWEQTESKTNLRPQGVRPRAGALLAIVGDDEPFDSRDHGPVTENLIDVSLHALRLIRASDAQNHAIR
jgi:uridine phosphorylase